MASSSSVTTRLPPTPSALVQPLLICLERKLRSIAKEVPLASRESKYVSRSLEVVSGPFGLGANDGSTPPAVIKAQREALRGIFVSMPDSIISMCCVEDEVPPTSAPSPSNSSSATEFFINPIEGYDMLLSAELAERRERGEVPSASDVLRSWKLAERKIASAQSNNNDTNNTKEGGEEEKSVKEEEEEKGEKKDERPLSSTDIRRLIHRSRLALWQGDMSLLDCDAVVNPANNALLGCFLPSHRCLDNILHAQAGPGLRLACRAIVDELIEAAAANGSKKRLTFSGDANGQCRVTDAFCLPSRCVFHTVGPNLNDSAAKGGARGPRAPTPVDAAELRSCYTTCLSTALQMRLSSIAFCCVSTGIFGYPGEAAAHVAIDEVLNVLEAEVRRRVEAVAPSSGKNASDPSSVSLKEVVSVVEGLPIVIFNVFKNEDKNIYAKLLLTNEVAQ